MTILKKGFDFKKPMKFVKAKKKKKKKKKKKNPRDEYKLKNEVSQN